MTKIEVKNWEVLAAEIRRCEEAEPKIYRGVTNFEHKLVPKIGRAGARKNSSDGSVLPHSMRDEKKFLELFKRTARPFLSFEPKSDFEWLAVAQHHGAPTRLLDWTQSPLIAAFFAMEKAGTEKQGQPAVFVLDPPAQVADEDPFSLTDVRAYYPPHISPRIQAQSGIFTVHPCPASEYEPAGLQVWLFPEGKSAWDLKRVIDRCGFNHASIYPGLDGLARHVGWCYKWGRFIA